MPAEYSNLVEKYRKGYSDVGNKLVEIGQKPHEEIASAGFSQLMTKLRNFAQYDTFHV